MPSTGHLAASRREFLARCGSLMAVPAAGSSFAVTATAASAPDPVRGQADVDLSVTTEEDRDSDEVKYLPAENEVRYVSAWTTPDREEYLEEPYPEEPPEREPEYTTTPWERWATTQSLGAAGEAAAEYLADETDLAHGQVGHGISSRVPEGDRGAIVLVRDPETAELDIDDLAASTPGTVEVTYVLDDQEFEYAAPVFVQIEPEVTELEGQQGAGDLGLFDGDAQRERLLGLGVLGGIGAAAAGVLGYQRLIDD